MEKDKSEQNIESHQEPVIRLGAKLRWKYYKLKFKIKNIKIEKDKISIKFFIGLAFFSIIVGLIIFLVFMLKLSNDFSITGEDLMLDKTGQVGDFIGGIVGAIWALTGVLLFYAALRLQSRELAENRKHFQMSRLTEIIYKQLDLFNERLSNFKLKDIERDSNGLHLEYRGRAAISIMRNRLESILEVVKEEKSEEEKLKESMRFMRENFAFIEINKNELLNIYEELDNHISVIRAVLIKEDIPPSDLNELKSLFFRNIGRDFLNSSELIAHFIDFYITFQKRQNKLEEDDPFSPESIIKRKVAVIEEFRKKRYDKKTIRYYLKNREMYNETYF